MYQIRLAAIAAALLLAACGGDSVSPGSTNNPPPQPAAVKTIELAPATATVAVGLTRALTATPRDANGVALTGRAIAWTSSAAAVALVDANGVVTGVAAGTATISAASEGVTGTAAITVTAPVVAVPVATVTVGPTLDTLEAYDPHTMQAVLRDSANNVLNGRVVRWTSSNPALATIDSVTGVLTGVDRGTVTITAKSEDKTGTATRVIVIKYRSIAAGSMHACDIASGGFVWCWGQNGKDGRIGSATLGDNAMSAMPVLVPNTGYNALRFTQLSSYGTHTCGITTESRAYCWGNNGWGQVGLPGGVGQSNVPVGVSTTLAFRQVSTGADHSCGVTTDNRAYCWGHNDWRQFATATPASSATPIAVAPELAFATITAATGFTCGVTTTGAAYCWGESGLGQLGDGAAISYGNTFSVAPVPVKTGAVLRSIDGALSYTCALTTQNEALCWGSNGGRLGNAGTTDSSLPVAVAIGIAFNSISTGSSHSCGIAVDGALWCWGVNGNGQLGTAAPAVATSPVRAGGTLRAAEVSAAGVSTGFGNHTCAISADRLTSYCFGRNETGQLGNGNTSTATAVNPTPTIVVGQKPIG
jgi:alpha-tubulin suppressor-like RCC1 family protein